MSLLLPIEFIANELGKVAASSMGVAIVSKLMSQLEEWDIASGGKVLPQEYWLLKEIFKVSPVQESYVIDPPIEEVNSIYSFFLPASTYVRANTVLFRPPNSTIPNNNKNYTPYSDKPISRPNNSGDDTIQYQSMTSSMLNVIQRIKFRLLEEGDSG